MFWCKYSIRCNKFDMIIPYPGNSILNTFKLIERTPFIFKGNKMYSTWLKVQRQVLKVYSFAQIWTINNANFVQYSSWGVSLVVTKSDLYFLRHCCTVKLANLQAHNVLDCRAVWVCISAIFSVWHRCETRYRFYLTCACYYLFVSTFGLLPLLYAAVLNHFHYVISALLKTLFPNIYSRVEKCVIFLDSWAALPASDPVLFYMWDTLPFIE